MNANYPVLWYDPKYGFRILNGAMAELVREINIELCWWRGIEIVAGNVQASGDSNTAEIIGRKCDRITEGKECDKYIR